MCNGIFAPFINCPPEPNGGTPCEGFAGTLRPGSTPEQAIDALKRIGISVPSNYMPRRANGGKGWVFQEPGAGANRGAITAMESDANPILYPNGYARKFNWQDGGQPLDLNGKPGSRSDTHFGFGPEE
jgi:hypothetical protein